jgi:hypothetical protein
LPCFVGGQEKEKGPNSSPATTPRKPQPKEKHETETDQYTHEKHGCMAQFGGEVVMKAA